MIHKEAAINTLKLIAAGILSSTAMMLVVKYVTLEAFLYFLGAAAFGFMVYTFYSMEKTRLETLDKLKKM